MPWASIGLLPLHAIIAQKSVASGTKVRFLYTSLQFLHCRHGELTTVQLGRFSVYYSYAVSALDDSDSSVLLLSDLDRAHGQSPP